MGFVESHQVIVHGPKFVSIESEIFLEANGVKHIKSAPYSPASNGVAERSVQTFKQSLLTLWS